MKKSKSPRPQTRGVEPKLRWLERGKTLLIVLLTLSAGYLLTVLMAESGLSGLLPGREPAEGPGNSVTLTAATLPSSIVVTTDGGRYGIQYDQTRVDELFARLGPLLGDALVSAGQPQVISEQDWQVFLSGESICFDFAGDVPLFALGGWLSGAGKCSLKGSARRLLLCAGKGDGVLLCWQDADSGLFSSCATALTRDLHLAPVVGEYPANGAYFAYEDEVLSRSIRPYTLITEEQAGAEYSVSNPLNSSNTAVLLSALSFNDQNHTRISSGEVYLDDGDRLEVEDDGIVTYRNAQGEKYPVGNSASEAIEAARKLAEGAVGALCGEAGLYLISARQEEDGFLVRFGYRLNGSAVQLHQEGWCAQFLIQDGYVAEFTLRLRSYAATGEEALLLPIDRAAAMLPALTEGRSELSIQYLDQGGDTVSPQWVAT